MTVAINPPTWAALKIPAKDLRIRINETQNKVPGLIQFMLPSKSKV
jgi:hypothetical protein